MLPDSSEHWQRSISGSFAVCPFAPVPCRLGEPVHTAICCLLSAPKQASHSADSPLLAQNHPADTAVSADLVGRFGGDEFVVMLEETSEKGATAVVARLESRMWSAPLPEQMHLSFCWGVGFFRPGMDFSTLFQQADQDLMRRKNAARSSRI